jgi:6-phosphogluconolactonase
VNTLPKVETYPDTEFSYAVAERIVSSLRNGGSIVLSGGSTPFVIYEFIARKFADALPWHDIDIFFGDERWVSPQDPKSNYGATVKAFKPVLDRVKLHPVPTLSLQSPERSASEYGKIIDSYLDKHAHFTVVLLGIGEDGHTASLFPGTRAVNETSLTALACKHPQDNSPRVSLSRSVLTKSKEIFFIANGARKSTIVRDVIYGDGDENQYPARIYRDNISAVTFLLDTAAAELLPVR